MGFQLPSIGWPSNSLGVFGGRFGLVERRRLRWATAGIESDMRMFVFMVCCVVFDWFCVE